MIDVSSIAVVDSSLSTVELSLSTRDFSILLSALSFMDDLEEYTGDETAKAIVYERVLELIGVFSEQSS